MLAADGGSALAAEVTAEMINGAQIDQLFPNEALTAPDFYAAAKWARRAAAADSAQSQAVLRYVLTSIPERMRDLDTARSARFSGSLVACCLLLGARERHWDFC